MSKAKVPQISLNVMIMTRDEFNKHMDDAFQRGVKRGKYEARNPPEEPVTDNTMLRHTGRLYDG